MRVILTLVALSLFSVAYPQEQTYAERTKLKASFTASLNSNGISSIPAFSLGAPAIVATAGLAKGRFSYDPVLAYGLDMRPWYIDSWVHYLIIDGSSFKMRTGINFSMYFSDLKMPDKDVLQGDRYWAFELAGMYYFDEKTNLTLMYWNDRGQDPGTITGHFITLAGDRSGMEIGKHLFWGLNLQIFYIGYTGNNDGFFVAPKVNVSARELPLSVYFQATQAITSNIEPFPGFKWNIGISYTF